MLRRYEYTIETVKEIIHMMESMCKSNFETLPAWFILDEIQSNKTDMEFVVGSKWGDNSSLMIHVDEKSGMVKPFFDPSLPKDDPAYVAANIQATVFNDLLFGSLTRKVWAILPDKKLFSISYIGMVGYNEIGYPKDIFIHGDSEDEVREYVQDLIDRDLFIDSCMGMKYKIVKIMKR